MAAEDQRSLVGQISLVNELISHRVAPALKSAGLNIGTFELLAAAKFGAGKLSQTELADQLGITPPSLCEAVQAASKKGLVEQIPEPSDGRKKRVRLTTKGEKAVATALEAFKEVDAMIAKSIPARDRENALKALAKISDVLD